MLSEYEAYLARLPFSRHTRRNYALRVKRFLIWLEDLPDGAKALSEPVERDFVVHEYKNYLLRSGCAANTVNSTLAAMDNFYLYIGIGPAKIKRQELPKQSPRALDKDEQRRFIRAVAGSKSVRNQAIAILMLHCGLRISETAQLNNCDVVLTARKREVTIRCGKNSKHRTVPVNKDAAEVLQQYIDERQKADPEAPLFLSQKGTRLSLQSIDYLIRQLGKEATLELSAHALRHTFITKLVRANVDIVAIAELAGHGRIETTRRYSLPSQEVMLEAVERLNYAAPS